jgi:ABC-type multidrug transport system permease subunit
MKREVMMINRDRATVVSRIIKKAVMSLILGSLFYDLPHGQSGYVIGYQFVVFIFVLITLHCSLRTRQGVAFFLQLFLAFGNIGALASFYNDKRVFYTQRDAKYYSPASYFMSKTIIELPIIIVESFVFGTITYWMVGLNSDAGRYFFAMFMLVM